MNWIAKSDGQSLKQHLKMTADLAKQMSKALPTLANLTENEQISDELLLGALLHDAGKAHPHWQSAMSKNGTGANLWKGQRHELYSLPLLSLFSQEEAVFMAVAAHHKDSEELFKLLSAYADKDALKRSLMMEYSSKQRYHPLDFEKNFSSNMDIKALLKMIAELMSDLNFDHSPENNEISPEKALQQLESGLRDAQEKSIFADAKQVHRLFLWGGLRLADHMASAGMEKIGLLRPEALRNMVKIKAPKRFSHQNECDKAVGSIILTAPTGSGKTEASFLWAARQLDHGQGRLFYCLPFTASINAMYDRLSPFFQDELALLHGKMSHFIDDRLDESDGHKVNRIKEEFRFMVRPLKIVTPFQLLKHFFGVRGFEKGLTEMAGAVVIFDEIHVYDTLTLAQITVMLEFLKNLGARALFMSATLPAFLKEIFRKSLGALPEIRPEHTFLEGIARHHIQLRQGCIDDDLDSIRQSAQAGLRVLVICNTVLKAQEIWNTLNQQEIENTVLLHSQFIADDRLEKENLAFEKDTTILVATQVVEVSLDLDYDILYTEPAPLDALLQRMGRVNRKGRLEKASVIVYARGGEFDHKIYPQETIKRTLEVLSEYPQPNESQIQSAMDLVYPAFSEKEARIFNDSRTNFRASIESLRLYSHDRADEEAYFQQFTAIPILPWELKSPYAEYLENGELRKAEGLLISIHHSRFFALQNPGNGLSLISRETFTIENAQGKLLKYSPWIAHVKYRSDIGLTREPIPHSAEEAFV
jgi:CRISPR-associated endonuclease/helicase Cas3